MRSLPAFLLALTLSGPLAGCDQVRALAAKAAPAGSAAGRASPPAAHRAPEGEHGAQPIGAQGGGEFALPFAWETSAAEPLGRARTFLKEMFAANGDYATLNQKLFPAYAEKQSPRATVVSCADSRVHTSAFDASPENDAFMVRNIGNQVRNAVGSVEYGIEHLGTPVLLVLGHTGCGAVKAVMDGTGKLEKPIQKELEHLKAPKRQPRRGDREAWVDAVVANVHDQVAFSLAEFGRRVHSGKLTVVGAVVDFRNDMGLGAGRLVVVDVNGNREPERIEAFVEAVTGRRGPEKRPAAGARTDAKRSGNEPLVEALASLAAHRRGGKAAPAGPDPGPAHDEPGHAH